MRHKSGLNRIFPKYTLALSDGNKFLLTGKKRTGNATSNYLISLDQEKLGKESAGYLGKVRSNFLGTEFYIYDTGENPDKAKTPDIVRRQHGVVQYETNVLGSKGPRRMKVLLPNVDIQGNQAVWRSADVSFFSLFSIFFVKIGYSCLKGIGWKFGICNHKLTLLVFFTLCIHSLANKLQSNSRLIIQSESCSSLISHPSGTSVSDSTTLS